MKPKEYEKLQAYYRKAERLKDSIDDITLFLRAIQRRVKAKDMTEYHIYISRKDDYGSGASVTIPEETILKTVVPPFKVELKRLKKEYKELPTF